MRMEQTFTIRLADLIIRVTTIHDEAHQLCNDYLCDSEERPDIAITTDQADIDYERMQDKLGDYEDSYYETLAVYRKIAEKLPRFARLLVHGSAVAIEQRAWLFMAPSGTGKSTHTRWWRTEFADEHPYMVNDDKPIIGLCEDGVFIYGTPWDGKEHLSANVRVPLAAIGLLERSEGDFAESFPTSEVIPAIMPHVYKPTGREEALATIETLHRLSDQVALFRVGVTNSANAARVTRDAMAT